MGRPKKKKSLLDDTEGTAAGEGGFRINEEYARRFQHNKEREDLHRLKELQKRGFVKADNGSEAESSDSETEDEDGLLPEETEAKIFETLAKIRKKDPTIYKPDVKFFTGEELAVADREPKKDEHDKKNRKPVYLKDVIAQQLLDGGEGDDKEGVQKDAAFVKKGKSYSEEQEELKKAFLEGVAAESDEEEGDGLLKVRRTPNEEEEGDDAEGAEERANEVSHKLQEYFGKDDALDENEKFLKQYLLNQQWLEKDKERLPSYGQLVGDSEDEDEVEKQELFEANYNFRFEEPEGAQIAGHSRTVEQSVRKKDETRKKERERKRERELQQEQARREELKRLKNLKKKEILEKVDKIREVAGATESEKLQALLTDDLEEEFDPDAYDTKMSQAFGDDYYAAEDPNPEELEPEEDLEKPVLEDSDEELAKLETREESKGFRAVREKQQQQQEGLDFPDPERAEPRDDQEAEPSEEEQAEPEEDREVGTGEGKKKRKDKSWKVLEKEKVAFDKHLEEYYKLDYEDVVGDLPTRFKYRDVAGNTYGMTIEDILELDDKELNAYVSLKKLAPYRTQEWVPNEWLRKKWRLSRRERKSKKLEHHGIASGKGTYGRKQAEYDAQGKESKKKKEKKEKVENGQPLENGAQKEQEVQENGEGKKKKRSRKRKKGGEAVTDMSASRLQSYGQGVPAKTAKKARW